MGCENFTIKLAGINIRVCASFFSSKEYCRDYLSNETADINVSVSGDDIAEEAQASEIKYSDEYFETLAIYRKIADALIDYNIILMHGSAVSISGNCHILTGPSGAGKSTHAALLKQYAPYKINIINDDKPLIKITNTECEVFGTPWDGSHRISQNTSAPLKSICFINKSNENEMIEISKDDALEKMIPQIFKPENPAKVSKSLDLIKQLMKNTKFYQLNCTKDNSAAKLSYRQLIKL